MICGFMIFLMHGSVKDTNGIRFSQDVIPIYPIEHTYSVCILHLKMSESSCTLISRGETVNEQNTTERRISAENENSGNLTYISISTLIFW